MAGESSPHSRAGAIAIRTIFAVYSVAILFVAFALAGFPAFSLPVRIGLIGGIVFHIIASAVFSLVHHKENRGLWEIVAAAALPFAAYVAAFGWSGAADRHLWIVVGMSQFLFLTGGFLAGLLLSPIVAMIRGRPMESVGFILESGVAFLGSWKRILAACVLFLAVAGGFAAAIWLVFREIQGRSQNQRLVYFAVLTTAAAVIARASYRQTVFGGAGKPDASPPELERH